MRFEFLSIFWTMYFNIFIRVVQIFCSKCTIFSSRIGLINLYGKDLFSARFLYLKEFLSHLWIDIWMIFVRWTRICQLEYCNIGFSPKNVYGDWDFYILAITALVSVPWIIVGRLFFDPNIEKMSKNDQYYSDSDLLHQIKCMRNKNTP